MTLRTFQNAYIVPHEDGRKLVDHVGVNNITIVVLFYVFLLCWFWHCRSLENKSALDYNILAFGNKLS